MGEMEANVYMATILPGYLLRARQDGGGLRIIHMVGDTCTVKRDGKNHPHPPTFTQLHHNKKK